MKSVRIGVTCGDVGGIGMRLRKPSRSPRVRACCCPPEHVLAHGNLSVPRRNETRTRGRGGSTGSTFSPSTRRRTTDSWGMESRLVRRFMGIPRTGSKGVTRGHRRRHPHAPDHQTDRPETFRAVSGTNRVFRCALGGGLLCNDAGCAPHAGRSRHDPYSPVRGSRSLESRANPGMHCFNGGRVGRAVRDCTSHHRGLWTQSSRRRGRSSRTGRNRDH